MLIFWRFQHFGQCVSSRVGVKQPFSPPGPLALFFGLKLVDGGQEKEEGEGRGGRVRVKREGVTIELSTHTRPPPVTCVGLGQKKGEDARTHKKNKNDSFLTPNVRYGKRSWDKSVLN